MDFSTARDEIQGAFWVQWEADAPALNDSIVPDVFWEGVGQVGAQPEDKPWASVFVRHTLGSQAALAGADAMRRFRKLGIVTVQIFVPVGGGMGPGEELAKVAKKAFEGKTTAGAAWFRNVRINEVGTDGPWIQLNVLAEFEYDEFA